MELLSDLRVLYHLAVKPVRGADHAARLESFYAGQADSYDRFRRRLLQGREELWQSLDVPEEGTWVDLGGGTGANLKLFGDQLAKLRRVYLVDLSPSLLAVARKRLVQCNIRNVDLVEADATQFRPESGPVDVVTFSYSLTMIPDWFSAIDNALAMLRPGGRIGVVDFYVSRKHPAAGMNRHRWLTRAFWPLWFGCDSVFLSPDHAPYLHRRFEPIVFEERLARVPCLPLGRVPYYWFVGRKTQRPSD
jgi:S-adenosylmethionine-diacylgycerolhomoserine-N-methlytransferase